MAVGDSLRWYVNNNVEGRPIPAVLNAVLNVTHRFFSGNKILFFTYLLDPDEEKMASAFLTKVMAEESWAVTLVSRGMKVPREENRPKQSKETNAVFWVQDETAWRNILDILVRIRILGPLSKVLVVSSANPAPLLLDAWKTLSLINVTTVTYTSITPPVYHTLYPYETPLRIHTLNDSDTFFPEKIPENFNGYPLRVVAEDMEPYVKGDTRKDGIEIRILEAIADHFRLAVRDMVLDRRDRTRVYYLNGSANGLFRVISRHEADLLMSGLRRNAPRFELSDALPAHTEDRVLWAYPRPEKQHDWTSLYRTFSLFTWSLVAGLIIVIAAVSTLLQKFEPSCTAQPTRFSQHILFTWGYILELGSPVVPQTMLRRAFMAVTFLYTINLSCSYKSTLVTLLTTEKSVRALETPQEAVAAGLHFYLQRTPKPTDPDLDMWNSIMLPGRFTQTNNNSLGLEAAANRSGFSMSVEFSSRYLVIKHFLDGRRKSLVSYMKIPQNQFSVIMCMAPGHPLFEAFQRKTLQLLEGAITDVLRESLMYQAMVQTLKMRSGNPIQSSLPRKLTLNDLYAIFYIQITALLGSCILFSVELLYNHYRLLRERSAPVRSLEQ